MPTTPRISQRTLWLVALRAWLLQASWNFGRMQNLGFLYACMPVLRRLYRGRDLQDVCKRNLAYFNSNPVLALPILGAVVRLEEKQSRGEELIMGTEDFKAALAGPCAAMGDSFFWGTLRPLAAVTGVWLALAGCWWSVVVFLLLYNGPAAGLRIFGFMQGYRRDYRIVDDLQRWHLSNLAYSLRSVLVVMLGGLSAWLMFGGMERGAVSTAWGLLAIPGVLLVGSLIRRGVSALGLLLGLFGLLWIGMHLCSNVGF